MFYDKILVNVAAYVIPN